MTVPPSALNTGGSSPSDSSVVSRGVLVPRERRRRPSCPAPSPRTSPPRTFPRPGRGPPAPGCGGRSASCSSRAILYSSARRSAVSPITCSDSGQRKPSWYMPSTSGLVPHALAPARARQQVGHAAHGLDAPGHHDLGVPVADRAGRRGRCALRPLPQAMFTVKAGTSWGTPALKETWRATLGPPPAWRAQPKTTSSTCSGSQARSAQGFHDALGAERAWGEASEGARRTSRWECEPPRRPRRHASASSRETDIKCRSGMEFITPG